MITTPASEHDSIRRRCGFRPALALFGALALAGSAAIAATAPPAGQQKGPGNAPAVPHTMADKPGGGATSAEIAAAQKEVNDLSAKLHGLQTQLQDLKAQEPPPPGPNATAEEKKKYQKAHLQWQGQVDRVQHAIDAVTKQLDLSKKKLAALQAGRSPAGS